MSRPYISEDLRYLVATRADYLCEYCLIHRDDTFLGCEVDHIISLKHDGTTDEGNLAYACAFCNRQKGSDVGSILLPSREFIRFFNPRRDRWLEHFKLDGLLITPLTKIGEVTARILGFNSDDRFLERQTLISVGRYPTTEALTRMGE
jgi:hypothetical protein